MATFKALNVESDDEPDDEIDNTKEIQIEEALKVYQTALKFHSQGHKYLEEAGEAYRDLFESEIFSYPESQSEYNRAEALGSHLAESQRWLYEPETRIIPSTGAADNAPSTLPQILHLSYKNRGQFHLDSLQALIKKYSEDGQAFQHTRMLEGAMLALKDFGDALDKDESNADLWRRAARVGRGLGSKTLSRYCLEAALDGDDEDTDEILGIPSIEVDVASHELLELHKEIKDDLASFESANAGVKSVKLHPLLKHQLQLYPFLPLSPPGTPEPQMGDRIPTVAYIEIETCSWTAIGLAIQQRLAAERSGSLRTEPGTVIRLSTSWTHGEIVRALKSDSPKLPDQLIRQTPEEQKESSEVLMEDVSANIVDTVPEEPAQLVSDGVNLDSPEPLRTLELPTRKRSCEAAELPENAEGGRIRSKRIRARESNVIDGVVVETIKPIAASSTDPKISLNVEADNILFSSLDSLAKRMDISSFNDASILRDFVINEGSTAETHTTGDAHLTGPMLDLYSALRTWNDHSTNVLLKSVDGEESSTEARNAGLVEFLEHSRPFNYVTLPTTLDKGADSFIALMNKDPSDIETLAVNWTMCLLDERTGIETRLLSSSDGQGSSYISHAWPEDLKSIAVLMIMNLDELLYAYISRKVTNLDDNILGTIGEDVRSSRTEECRAIMALSQTLFEMHLDVYCRIINPLSDVNEGMRNLQKTRLEKWSGLARDAVNLKVETFGDADHTTMRHIWASAIHLSVISDVSREHLLLCITDLRLLCQEHTRMPIKLPNNQVMPELSAAAADRELSKLETMSFFLNIFQKDDKHPVDLIERLEPILIPPSVTEIGESYESDSNKDTNTEQQQAVDNNEIPRHASQDIEVTSAQVLSKFLKTANASLRLSLWQRLRSAYEAIDYKPKVFSIYLRTIELLIEELKRPENKTSANEREECLLQWLRKLDGMLTGALTICDEIGNAFECIDLDHLRSSVTALSELGLLLHVVSIYDDYCEVTQKGGPTMNPFRQYPSEPYHRAAAKLHDMQIRVFKLLYRSFQEAALQLPHEFPNPTEDRLELLRNFHHALGVRRICKASEGLFLNFMKDELLGIPELDVRSSDDLAQVLFDMYDLYCFSSPMAKWDHGCDGDYMYRTTALEVVDFVLGKARKMNIRDVLKSDLSKTIDKLNNALGLVKEISFTAARNKRIYATFVRSPIHPLQLFRSLEGIGELPTVPVPKDESIIASKGWYFLRGQMVLAKYRSQRSKGGSTPSDEVQSALQNAIALFAQDLEYSSGRWETWYRLAQANDALLEEHVLWSAEKLNTARTELNQGQRASIHAYMMAVATAVRSAELSEETNLKLSELYSDFGMRIYSSSREPYAMDCFSLEEFPSRFNSDGGGRTYKRSSFQPLNPRKAWEFAAILFKRAIFLRPNHWINHYMLGKCLGKSLGKIVRLPADATTVDDAERIDEVVQCFLQAARIAPDRSTRQEPILEPIYKLVSFVHKLVLRNWHKHANADAAGTYFSDIDGAKILTDMLQCQKQFEISKVPEYNHGDYTLPTQWQPYILEVLNQLKAADKSRWHHRISVRIAQIIFDLEHDSTGAKKATDYLIEQHIFSTKTKSIGIWKPESERIGRHWVYTSRYAYFLCELLDESNDLEATQGFTRRVRKKTNDFYEHAKVWEAVALMDLKVHRRHGDVPEHFDDYVFKTVTHEEFIPRAEMIDIWCQSPETNHPLKSTLLEAYELKKINASLLKTTAIDDLLADTFAAIFFRMASQLEENHKQKQREEHSRTDREDLQHQDQHEIANAAGNIVNEAHQEENRGRMSLNLLMNVDGALDPSTFQPKLGNLNQALTTVQALSSTIQFLPSEQPSKPRAKVISRREILRRAVDAATIKVPATAIQAQRGSASRSGNLESNRTEAGALKSEDTTVNPVASETNGGTMISSAPGSIHDSADDESELSEPDAEMEDLLEKTSASQSLFPNMKTEGRDASVNASGDETGEMAEYDGEGEGDGEGDGEGEGEGEDEQEEEQADEHEGGGEEAGEEVGDEEEGEGEGEEEDVDEEMSGMNHAQAEEAGNEEEEEERAEGDTQDE